MASDRYSGEHANASPGAIEAFERAVWSVLAHRTGAAPAIDEALAMSRDFTAAHALRGFCGVTLARAETMAAARAASEAARTSLKRGAASESETALVEALHLAVSGRLLDAAVRLEERLERAPRDLLALKLAHSLRFMAGDPAGMLAATERGAAQWTRDMEGYGFALGCHAFALEENARYGEAEAVARRAVDEEPFDAWGAHALGHVFEMQRRSDEGVRWFEQTRAMWTGCNNFAFHMAWHLALCHVEEGRIDVALALYDDAVRPVPTDDFRDVANAVSLLWRLRQENIDVGGRWLELAELARKRATDCTLVFASLHHLLTLAAVGDAETAHELLAALATRATTFDDQAQVAREIGVDLARALATPLFGARPSARPTGHAPHIQSLGGSRAQRDVFMRTLALLAADAADGPRTTAILQARGKTCLDRFDRMTRARLAEAATPLQVA